MRVMVVDDDRAVREALERAFRLEGHKVRAYDDGGPALRALAVEPPDVIVLDIQMPEVDGLEVCRRLRDADDQTPVLMLTARDAIDDRVEGLDAGADDYLVKPFALAELLARVRALGRRREGDGTAQVDATGAELSFEDLRLDTTTREAYRGQRELELTKTEFELLRFLLEHPRQVLTRTQIFEAVWDYDFGPSSNSLEVYVGYLRRKTEAEGEPRLIQTVRGVGYTVREK